MNPIAKKALREALRLLKRAEDALIGRDPDAEDISKAVHYTKALILAASDDPGASLSRSMLREADAFLGVIALAMRVPDQNLPSLVGMSVIACRVFVRNALKVSRA